MRQLTPLLLLAALLLSRQQSNAQTASNPIGIYISKTKLPKEIDSLVINSDSTYRFGWYYPTIKGSEWDKGKWTIKNGQLLLFSNVVNDKEPLFTLNIIASDHNINAVIIKNTALTIKWFKNIFNNEKLIKQ